MYDAASATARTAHPTDLRPLVIGSSPGCWAAAYVIRASCRNDGESVQGGHRVPRRAIGGFVDSPPPNPNVARSVLRSAGGKIAAGRQCPQSLRVRSGDTSHWTA